MRMTSTRKEKMSSLPTKTSSLSISIVDMMFLTIILKWATTSLTLMLFLSAQMRALFRRATLLTTSRIRGTRAMGNWINLRSLWIMRILARSHRMSR